MNSNENTKKLLMDDWPHSIRNMHEKFKTQDVVNNMDKNILIQFLLFRLECIHEEYNEAREALNHIENFENFKYSDTVISSCEDFVDALIDLCVFAVGTLDLLQVDATRAWKEVMYKNIQKVPGEKESRKNNFGFPDLIKPEGWTSPSHKNNIGLLSMYCENQLNRQE